MPRSLGMMLLLVLGPVGAGCGAESGVPAAAQGRHEKVGTGAVEWVWSGAVGPRAVRVNAKLSSPSRGVRLLVSRRRDLSQARVLQPRGSGEGSPIVSVEVRELDPQTTYFYALEVDGVVDPSRVGRFQTPGEGPFSFTVAFGSCARTGSQSPVFDTVRRHAPLLVLLLGDLHYENIGSNRRSRYRRAYDRVLTSPVQQRLFLQQPIAYVWDDHDFGGNNSDSTAAGREAARLSYQEVVPHYPLPAGSGDVPIYQAFSVGRVRFLLTDTRSERSPRDAPDGPRKTMLGESQKAWLKGEVLRASSSAAVIVWVNSVPWVGRSARGADHWGGYDVERRELVQFFEKNEVRNLIILSGDAHMLAIDDGSNSPGAIPVMQAGAFDRTGSVKGGPYSEGTYPGGGQFGLMTVEDDGGPTVNVAWSGRNWRDEELVGHRFTLPRPRSTP